MKILPRLNPSQKAQIALIVCQDGLVVLAKGAA